MPGPGRGRAARHVDVVVIGAGHAGLAASYCLSERAIDHIVLERGEVANSWRLERWDSLTLLTPNWQSHLPGYRWVTDDPDGFMAMPEVIQFIEGYADFSNAPVRTRTEVTSLRANGNGYALTAGGEEWRCRAVVIASGACNLPRVPAIAEALPRHVDSVTPFDYHDPHQLAEGGVLVVGASATGLQLAEEIHRSGRPVTIATGEMVRMPRTYRGRDIQWWMDAAGILDENYHEIDDLNRARHLPSPQLIGSHEHQILDLNAMSALGIGLVGRLAGIRDGVAQFSGSLRNVCALADLKMNRLLGTIDEWAESHPDAVSFEPPERFPDTRIDTDPPLELDLKSGEIRTVLWATGFHPDYSWLEVPVLDRKGMIRHDGGVADAPGMYVLGMPFLRRRKSSFIHGIEDDVHDLMPHIECYLRTQP